MAHTINFFQYFLFSVLLFGSVSAQTLTADTDPLSSTFGEFYVSLESEFISKIHEQGDEVDFSTFFYVSIDSVNKIIGSYTLQGDRITFKPRFLPDTKLVHQAFLDVQSLYELAGLPLPKTKDHLVRQSFVFKPENDIKSASVAGISPTFNTYPANILRLYLYFDQPMSLQNPYDYISLLNEQGETIAEPFVIIPEGLWDESKTRLTLFFHPGRIKRNVGPNTVIGSVFEAGNTYTLKIDSTWRSAAGSMFNSSYEETFAIGKALRSPIQPEKWIVSEPETQYADLILRTIERLDPVLFPKMVKVLNQQQMQVEGVWKQNADKWHFIPTSNWLKGKYFVKIDPKLEDVCGNTIQSAFDRESTESTINTPVLELQFEVR